MVFFLPHPRTGWTHLAIACKSDAVDPGRVSEWIFVESGQWLNYNRQMLSNFSRHLKGWISWLATIALTLAVIFIGEWLPLMPAFQRFQESHPAINQALIVVTLTMTIMGTLLLVFTQFLVHVPEKGEAQPKAQSVKTVGVVKGPGRYFSGKIISTSFSDEARFWRVRKAIQDDEWWRVPRWRRFTLMMLGAILLFYGLFGLLFLLFTPGVKFLLFLVVIYATVRSVYAFAVDQSSGENESGSS